MPWSKAKWFKIVVGVSTFLWVAALGSRSASAAELNSEPGGRSQPVRVHLHHKSVVAPAACGWKCRGGCPDGYSCSPLYGAYGIPYGSPAYWARYTVGGWGH
jgi:hypothetical protein